MNHFPQLNQVSICQLPAVKSGRRRTSMAVAAGGRSYRYLDAAGRKRVWGLELQALTDVERAGLDTFFGTVEGRLQRFTFLDPFGNLFAWSEDFAASAWVKQAPLVLSGGQADPFGGAGATMLSNPAPAVRRMSQSLGIRGDFRYTLSLYARSAAPVTVRLLIQGASGALVRDETTSTAWTRLILSGKRTGAEDSLEAGLEIPAGADVTVFGAQLEAQPVASAYKKTEAEGGVYPQARFTHDELVWRSSGVGDHSTFVEIASS